jgi:adenylate cyclase class 2
MSNANRETEAKFYIRNIASIEDRLRQMKARLIQPRTHELNWRFDTASGDLQRDQRVLRLRQDREIHLTYKDNSEFKSGALSRREIEFSTNDLDSARNFLEALGYEVVFEYEKYRTTYSMSTQYTKKNTTPESRYTNIMLDELPFGNFVEIEGEWELLKPTAGELGLKWETAIPISYHALFEHLRQTHTLGFRDLTFENFKTIQIQANELDVRPADE